MIGGRKPIKKKKDIAEIWSDILLWELKNSMPKLIVIMGQRTRQLLDHVSIVRGMQLPKTIDIQHYAYIGSRPDNKNKLPAMAPQRIAAYDSQFAEIKRVFQSL